MSVHNEVNFAIIPEWVLFANISPQAVRLYGVLNRYANNKTKRCYPSRATLMKELRVSNIKTVDRALKELVRIEAVSVKKRLSDQGDPTSNEYLVRVTQVAPQMSLPSPTSVASGSPTDVAQNESHIELEPPLPPKGGSNRFHKPNPRVNGTNPRAVARAREKEKLERQISKCPDCGSGWICTRCDARQRKLAAL